LVLRGNAAIKEKLKNLFTFAFLLFPLFLKLAQAFYQGNVKKPYLLKGQIGGKYGQGVIRIDLPDLLTYPVRTEFPLPLSVCGDFGNYPAKKRVPMS
jgi:hypothetical protein